MKGAKWLVAPWLAAMGLLVYRSFNDGKGALSPATAVRANIPFTMLAFLSEASVPFAVSMGWGLVVAVLLFNPTILNPPGAPSQNVAPPGLNPDAPGFTGSLPPGYTPPSLPWAPGSGPLQ